MSRDEAGRAGTMTCHDQSMPRQSSLTKYPQRCDVLVFAREPTERELRIDLRPGAVNPTAPTRPCGDVIADDADELRHMASAHPELLRFLELLAEIGIDRARAGKSAPARDPVADVRVRGRRRRAGNRGGAGTLRSDY